MTETMTTAAYLKMQKKPKSSKYKNVKVRIDDILFDSKAEAAYYEYLKMMVIAGDVTHFLMQVPFLCGGGVKYRLDFMVFLACGDVDHVDIKGSVTSTFKNKKKQVESRYPIKIRCLFKNGNKFMEKNV